MVCRTAGSTSLSRRMDVFFLSLLLIYRYHGNFFPHLRQSDRCGFIADLVVCLYVYRVYRRTNQCYAAKGKAWKIFYKKRGEIRPLWQDLSEKMMPAADQRQPQLWELQENVSHNVSVRQHARLLPI